MTDQSSTKRRSSAFRDVRSDTARALHELRAFVNMPVQRMEAKIFVYHAIYVPALGREPESRDALGALLPRDVPVKVSSRKWSASPRFRLSSRHELLDDLEHPCILESAPVINNSIAELLAGRLRSGRDQTLGDGPDGLAVACIMCRLYEPAASKLPELRPTRLRDGRRGMAASPSKPVAISTSVRLLGTARAEPDCRV